MTTRNKLLDQIRLLKIQRKSGWFLKCKVIFCKLNNMDDPYRDLAVHGNDQTGRSQRIKRIIPIEDDYTEDSEP
jgi:hypothetical protein